MQIMEKMLSQRIKYTYQASGKHLATHPNFNVYITLIKLGNEIL